MAYLYTCILPGFNASQIEPFSAPPTMEECLQCSKSDQLCLRAGRQQDCVTLEKLSEIDESNCGDRKVCPKGMPCNFVRNEDVGVTYAECNAVDYNQEEEKDDDDDESSEEMAVDKDDGDELPEEDADVSSSDEMAQDIAEESDLKKLQKMYKIMKEKGNNGQDAMMKLRQVEEVNDAVDVAEEKDLGTLKALFKSMKERQAQGDSSPKAKEDVLKELRKAQKLNMKYITTDTSMTSTTPSQSDDKIALDIANEEDVEKLKAMYESMNERRSLKNTNYSVLETLNRTKNINDSTATATATATTTDSDSELAANIANENDVEKLKKLYETMKARKEGQDGLQLLKQVEQDNDDDDSNPDPKADKVMQEPAKKRRGRITEFNDMDELRLIADPIKNAMKSKRKRIKSSQNLTIRDPTADAVKDELKLRPLKIFRFVRRKFGQKSRGPVAERVQERPENKTELLRKVVINEQDSPLKEDEGDVDKLNPNLRLRGEGKLSNKRLLPTFHIDSHGRPTEKKAERELKGGVQIGLPVHRVRYQIFNKHFVV